MALYADLVSLEHTLEHHVYLIETSVVLWHPLVNNVVRDVRTCIRLLLRRPKHSSNRRWNALDHKVREAVWELHDLLESQATSQILLHSRNLIGSHNNNNNNNPLNLPHLYLGEEVKQQIFAFMRITTEIEKEYQEIISRNLEPDDEQEEVVSSSSSSSSYSSRPYFHVGDTSELVGLCDEFDELKHGLLLNYDIDPTRKTEKLIPSQKERELMLISIVGMAGIGKTALAKAVCEDPEVWNSFEYHLFVPVGPNYQLKQVLSRILSQLNHGIISDDHEYMPNNLDDEEEKLAKCVAEILKEKRFIILLDDVWEKDIRNQLQEILPESSNGSRVMLTTRQENVDGDATFNYNYSKFKKGFLDKEQSWDLLCKKVFGADPCPYELKEVGRKIAERCEGLPLAIISVGNHLAEFRKKTMENIIEKAKKTVEYYWESVVEKGIANIIGADHELMKVLHPSYIYLDVHLKAPFLYLGVFPQTSEISSSKIVNLWISEGFIECNVRKDIKHGRRELRSIASNSLVVVKQERLFSLTVKTCQLHIVYWCYCKMQAPKEKLFQVLNTLEDCLLGGIKSQRRLCVHNNSLFGIKDTYNSMASVSNARSLLCTGSYHNYPVKICFSLKLLRILYAISIRFYEFPFEMLELVLLRYIAFTYDGDLHGSISQLINLWYLIVHRHHRIIYPRRPSYLPSEMWNMKELKHLQVVGSDLLEPPPGALLPELRKLLDVTPQSCTTQVLESIPNLKKLGVQIVLPVDSTEPLCSLDYLRNLNGLESLKCIVLNPEPSSQVAPRAYPTSIFPEGLKKLSLGGFGYSWDQVSEISVLPNLRMLKLRHCACQGSRWVVKRGEFPRLEFLLLEDIDVRYWDVDSDGLRWLRHLIIQHCYNLEQIPTLDRFKFAVPVSRTIEIVDCKPSVVASAWRLQESNPYCKVSVISSWDI